MEAVPGMYYNLLAERAVHDIDAFNELYEHFFPRVYNFVFARLKDAAESDDITGETFQKMYDHLADYDKGKSAFSTWLFRIASNTLTDHARKRARSQDTAWEDFFDPAAPAGEGPEARALAKEGREELLRAIGHLGEREQRIIELKYWSGLGNREIAEVMGLSESNVGTIVHRALAALRKRLSKDDMER